MKRKQTLSGYIRVNLTRIEKEMEAGFSQESIVDELKAEGFDTTVPILRTLLYRARQRAASRSETPTPLPAVGNAQQGSAPSAPPAPRPSSSPLKKSVGFEYKGTKDLDPDKMF